MSDDSSVQVYDVIGLGFGPSNLAIAGAFLENQLGAAISPISIDRLLFIEKYDEFKWHPAMLLPGAEMQISFLKDLATLRSPRSPLTFISYLHSQNRLLAFINRGRTIPTRKEYSDYLSWAAQYVQDRGVKVAFGEEVVALGEMDAFTIQVHSRVLSTGQHVVRLAKNLIISPGGSPCIPRPLATTWVQERMIHSSTYLTSVIPLLNSLQSRNPDGSPLRIAVIGSGQSAAEIVIDLRSRLATIPVIGKKAHTLDLIIRKGSLKPSDDSPFVNEIFNPETTNEIFRLPSHSARQKINLEYANANYGVINPRTLELLYEILYDQKLDEGISRRTIRPMSSANPKFTILRHSEVLSVETSSANNATRSRVELEPITLILQQTLTHDIYESSYDALICATGYERRSWLSLLAKSSLGKYFGLHEDAQDYARLEVEADLQGHGIDEDRSSTFKIADADDCSNSPSGRSTNSGNSIHTPTSLDWASDSDWPRERGGEATQLRISRAYRLLPTKHLTRKLLARIYVQGLAEETHGLSETLLSVVGTRAGEVIHDICMHFVSNDSRLTLSARL
ncbi:L-lysine 6-monooxygenase (NADPH-requiring)-domain-containing protein [Boletus coccyginus]|nr:L-lysine 6-monooxygenase (NADPH-requiring)-domain-containing protein [Boletus coccyginus]